MVSLTPAALEAIPRAVAQELAATYRAEMPPLQELEYLEVKVVAGNLKMSTKTVRERFPIYDLGARGKRVKLADYMTYTASCRVAPIHPFPCFDNEK